MRKTGPAALVAAVLLTACAAPTKREPVVTRYEPVGACVDDVARLQPRPLAVDDRAGPMVLGAVAQCLWVEGSARPAVLYRLGAFTPPLELRAAVHDRAGVVLAAQLQLLDARFRPIVVRRFSEFVARGRSWTTTAFANAGDGIAYVLLTSDPDWRDRTHRRNSGESQPIMVATPAVVFAIANGHERSENVVFGELGEFTLQASAAPSAADEG